MPPRQVQTKTLAPPATLAMTNMVFSVPEAFSNLRELTIQTGTPTTGPTQNKLAKPSPSNTWA